MKQISNFNGKIQPQALEFEEIVLGAILIDKNALNRVIDVLTPESFYKDAHQYIFEACLILSSAYKPIDIMSVTQQIKSMGKLEQIGGAYYIVTLTNRVASSANISYHAQVIAEKKTMRDIIALSETMLNQAYADETELKDLVDYVEKSFTQITAKVVKSTVSTSKELYNEVLERNDKLLENKSLIGVNTGLDGLNRVTGGFQNSDLIILAARPGMGKTSLALKFMRSACLSNTPTAIFSLEMSKLQLYSRIVSQQTTVQLESIIRRGMSEYELGQVMAKADLLCGMNMFFDDTPSISIFELKAKARRLYREKGVRFFVIDYLQLISNKIKGGNRESEISEISRELKGLAKELNVPILALAQLSRASEKRGVAAKPILSDLRESGSIEQDADIVMFIYRHEYYGIADDENGESTTGKAEIILAKHRNGEVGTIKSAFISSCTDFADVMQF